MPGEPTTLHPPHTLCCAPCSPITQQHSTHNPPFPPHTLQNAAPSNCCCRTVQPHDPKKDPQLSEAKNLMRRKRIQLEHAREHDDAVVSLKQKVSWSMCFVL